MSIIRDKFRFQLIMNFMFRYLMVLIVPFIIVSLIYFNSIQVIEQDTIKNNINVLEKAKDTLEGRLSEIDSIAEQISWNPKVIRYNAIAEPFKGANIYKALETRMQLYDYSLTNNLIQDYYVLYQNSGVLLGANQTYRMEQFYEYFFHYKGMNYEEWCKELSQTQKGKVFIPERQTYFRGENYKLLTYIRDLSGTSRGRESKIIFLLKGDEVQKLLNSFDLADSGWAYIADENGQILSSYSQNPNRTFHEIDLPDSKGSGYYLQNYNGEKFILTYVISEDNGWRFVVAQPYKILMKKVSNIKYIGYGFLGLALMTGVVLAYFWSNRYSQSIIKTYELFPLEKNEYTPRKDPYEYIQSSINEVITDNELLSNTIDQQVIFLRNSYYQQLINGDFPHEEDLYIGAKHIGLDLDGEAYSACVVQVLGYGQGLSRTHDDILNELDIRRLKVKDSLLNHKFSKTYIHDIARDRVLVLMVLQEYNMGLYKERIYGYMEAVRQELQDKFGIEIRFALDHIYSNPMELSRSIHDELHVLNYAKMEKVGREYIWCNEMIEPSNEFFFPEGTEIRLMNFTRDGNREKVADILKELEINNLIRRKLSPGMLRMFIYQLYGILIKITQELSVNNDEIHGFIEDMEAQGDSYSLYDEAFDFIYKSFDDICRKVTERKENENKKLTMEMREYIEKNYTDTNLSLTTLADEFNYSPTYLSLFFKEEFNENFSTYLESIRMKKATELLIDSGESVAEIAKTVGYNSSNSFGRAFKKKFGISPGRYREMEKVY